MLLSVTGNSSDLRRIQFLIYKLNPMTKLPSWTNLVLCLSLTCTPGSKEHTERQWSSWIPGIDQVTSWDWKGVLGVCETWSSLQRQVLLEVGCRGRGSLLRMHRQQFGGGEDKKNAQKHRHPCYNLKLHFHGITPTSAKHKQKESEQFHSILLQNP